MGDRIDKNSLFKASLKKMNSLHTAEEIVRHLRRNNRSPPKKRLPPPKDTVALLPNAYSIQKTCIFIRFIRTNVHILAK